MKHLGIHALAGAMLAAATAYASPATVDPTLEPTKAQLGLACSDLRLGFNPPDGQSWALSETTCLETCATTAIVAAESFSIDAPSYLTEVALWGGYIDGLAVPDPPPTESWTVIVHRQFSPVVATRPQIELARQVVTRIERLETGRSTFFSGPEYRWTLRLDEPVLLPSAGFYWIEAFHDSPDSQIAALLTSAEPPIGAAGFALSQTAPGDDWIAVENFDLALETCGFDAGWGGLIVPSYDLDFADPADSTLFAVRNTAATGRTVEIAYYGESFDDGPLRVDQRNLDARQTLPVNIGFNTSGLDPDGNGRARGFVVIRESDGTWDDLEGDTFRVDFTNNFASGSRLLEADELCRRQEVRVIDFGGGSSFDVLLREARLPTAEALTVSIYDEAGQLVDEVLLDGDGDNARTIDIAELSPTLSFGTLVFDFSASGGGVVTGSYSAFGRFSTELKGACRE